MTEGHCIPDMAPTPEELRAEAHRLVAVAAGSRRAKRTVAWVAGRAVVERPKPDPSLPSVGSSQWWAAPDRIRIASLLVLAEAWLLADPDHTVRERLRSVSLDLSAGMHEVSLGPSHGELMRRRYPPSGDADAWVTSGSDATSFRGPRGERGADVGHASLAMPGFAPRRVAAVVFGEPPP